MRQQGKRHMFLPSNFNIFMHLFDVDLLESYHLSALFCSGEGMTNPGGQIIFGLGVKQVPKKEPNSFRRCQNDKM